MNNTNNTDTLLLALQKVCPKDLVVKRALNYIILYNEDTLEHVMKFIVVNEIVAISNNSFFIEYMEHRLKSFKIFSDINPEWIELCRSSFTGSCKLMSLENAILSAI